MAHAKPKPKKEAFVIRSLTLTPEITETLENFASDATDFTGRKVSGSAVVRALLRYAERQGDAWVLSELCPFIEREQTSGVVWGKKSNRVS